MEQKKHQVICLPSLEMEARLILNEDDPNCGYANGYVGVKKTHPLYGVHYREFDYEIIVHGGVTFSGHIKSPTDDENDCNWLDEDYWWIGFDTKHSGDRRVTENYEYCLEQVVSLACQISSLTRNKYKLVPLGKETNRIINLEWEVQKLTEIKDKFKARAKQLKRQLAHRQYDHVEMVGLALPQITKKGDVVDRMYIEFESNFTGDFYAVEIDPYQFINWIGNEEVDSIKEFVKVKIDKL